MTKEIQRQLSQIEEDRDILILYAIESGSRAWGFESADSDYDVRFIYINTKQWYLSIEKQDSHIELPIEEDLDFSGWDIQKTLLLLQKSNPSLIEWLQSPIVYKSKPEFAEKLRSVSNEYFSPKPLLFHYLSMAKNTYKSYLLKPTVTSKKYLYAVRPILACKWILENNSTPPILFQDLLESELEDRDIRDIIDQIVSEKQNSNEKDTIPAVSELNDFISKNFSTIESAINSLSDELKIPTSKLDEIFMSELEDQN